MFAAVIGSTAKFKDNNNNNSCGEPVARKIVRQTPTPALAPFRLVASDIFGVRSLWSIVPFASGIIAQRWSLVACCESTSSDKFFVFVFSANTKSAVPAYHGETVGAIARRARQRCAARAESFFFEFNSVYCLNYLLAFFLRLLSTHE